MDGPRDYFSRIPNDVLFAILAKFCAHCCETRETLPVFHPNNGREAEQPSWRSLDCRALWSMCLVSTRFRPIAQRILYHEFVPGYGDYDNFTEQSWERRLIPFARTIARRPDLARLVQRIQLDDRLWTDVGPSHVQAVLQEAAQSRGFRLSDFLAPFQQIWVANGPWKSYTPCQDEMNTMLLACLPKLSRLTLSPTSAFQKGISPSALRVAGITSLPIQTIEVHLGFDALAEPLNAVLDMASGALTTLTVDQCDERAFCDPLHVPPSLQHLCLTEMPCSGSDLASLLSRCGSLRSFVFNKAWYQDQDAPSEPDITPAVTEQLLRSKDTLQKLHLCVKSTVPQPDDENAAYVTDLIPQLRNFSVLQYLFLDAVLIYGDDPNANGRITTPPLDQVLPPSLESLVVADNDKSPQRAARLENDVYRVREAAVLRGELPQLRSVMVLYDVGERGACGLVDLFTRAGIPEAVMSGWRPVAGCGNPPRCFGRKLVCLPAVPASQGSQIE